MSRYFLPLIALFLLVAGTAAHASSGDAEARAVWTANVGVGSLGAWNYVGVRRDVMFNEHVALYFTGGLGTILAGGGAAYYSVRNGSGVVASISAGVLGANANLVYQIRIDSQDYLVLGTSYGYYFILYIGWAPVLAYERRF
jgi:hypothetical protein